MKRHLILLAAAAACSKTQPVSEGARRLARPVPDVETLLQRMTLDEKLGQMTQADHGTLKQHPDDVRALFLGSVLSGGDSLPEPNQPATWADLYDRYQTGALETRLGIPLLYGVDAVHGHNGLR